MGIIKRFYICDRLKDCRFRIGCSRNGGECSHTTEQKHAKTGGFTIEERDGVLIIPDNVEAIKHNDGDIVLIEREEARSAES